MDQKKLSISEDVRFSGISTNTLLFWDTPLGDSRPSEARERGVTIAPWKI